MIDLATIRGRFPALTRVHNGHPVAYFDGPGGTQVPKAVADAMRDYLFHHNANTHWSYPSSQETDEAISRARRAVADLLNADPGEIAFGANMTTLTFHLARALGRAWGEGDEVVVTELDHHANVAPWQALARERGITLRTARMIPETGELDWGHLEQLVGPRTRLLAIGAASNALGTVNDIPRAVALAHGAGALIFVDAVHYAPHGALDVRAWDCDYLACSAYKFYGPHVGILYGRSELLSSLDVPRLAPAPEEAPERLETGTLNHEGIVGTQGAVDFLAWLGEGECRRDRLVHSLARLHQEGERQLAMLWEGLQAAGARVFGPPPGRPRTSTVSFVVPGIDSEEVARRLARQGLFVSHGDFYAATVAERLGYAEAGLVRVGCACYTTDEEVERVIEAVRGER